MDCLGVVGFYVRLLTCHTEALHHNCKSVVFLIESNILAQCPYNTLMHNYCFLLSWQFYQKTLRLIYTVV